MLSYLLFFPCFSFFSFACFSFSVITSCLLQRFSIRLLVSCSGRHSFLECCTNLQFTCSRVHLKYPSVHQLTSAPAGKKNNIKDKRTRLQSSEKFWKLIHQTGDAGDSDGSAPSVAPWRVWRKKPDHFQVFSRLLVDWFSSSRTQKHPQRCC